MDYRENVYAANIGIYIKAGTRDEEESGLGCAHFLEHILFKGTKTKNVRNLAQAIDDLGGNINAFTTHDYTCFYSSVLNDDFLESIDLLGEMLLESEISEESVNHEKKIILEEYDMYQDDQSSVCIEGFASSLFEKTPLGRNILGTKESIGGMTRKDLLDFHERYYVPEKMVVIVSGNFKEEEVLRKIESLFGKMEQRGQDTRSIIKMPPHKVFKPKLIVNKNVQQVTFAVGFLGLDRADPNFHYLKVLAGMLGGSTSSYLFQRVREELGLSYDIYCFVNSFFETGQFVISGGTNQDRFIELLEAVAEIIKKISAEGLNKKIFLRMQKQMIINILMNQEDSSASISRLGSQKIYYNKVNSILDCKRGLEKISFEGLDEFARGFLKTERMSLCAVVPEEIEGIDRIWSELYGTKS